MLALVGPSGGGKLLYVILFQGFYNDDGDIKKDGKRYI